MIWLSKAGILIGLVVVGMMAAIPMMTFAQTTAPDIESTPVAVKPAVTDASPKGNENRANKRASVQNGAPDDRAANPATADVKTQPWYQELRNELRRELLDGRAETIEWWLTLITIVLAFFTIGIPIAAYIAGVFSFRKFEEIKDQAQRYVEEIKGRRDEAEKSAQAAQELISRLANQAPEKVEQVDENIRESSEASLIEKAIEHALSLQKQGKRDQAIEKWHAIANVAEENDNVQAARAWFRVGYLRQDKDPEASILAYNKAIHLLPDVVAPYNNRGNAKAALARLEDAITDYDQAIRLKQDTAEPYFNRGLARKSLGRLDAAIADYDKVIQLKPNYAEAYYARGNAKKELGLKAEARKDFKMALELARKANDEKLVTLAEQALRDLGQDEGS